MRSAEALRQQAREREQYEEVRHAEAEWDRRVRGEVHKEARVLRDGSEAGDRELLEEEGGAEENVHAHRGVREDREHDDGEDQGHQEQRVAAAPDDGHRVRGGERERGCAEGERCAPRAGWIPDEGGLPEHQGPLGSLRYAAARHGADDLDRRCDAVTEECGDQDQQGRERSARNERDDGDKHRRALTATRTSRDDRLVDDLELNAADLEERRRHLGALDAALQIADAHRRKVEREAQLPTHVLVGVAQRRAVGAIELIERALSFEGLPLRELEIALIKRAQGGGGFTPSQLEPLVADDKGRLDQLGRQLWVARREGDAQQARAPRRDVEVFSNVVQVLLLVGCHLVCLAQRRPCDDLAQKASGLKELFQDLSLLRRRRLDE